MSRRKKERKERKKVASMDISTLSFSLSFFLVRKLAATYKTDEFLFFLVEISMEKIEIQPTCNRHVWRTHSVFGIYWSTYLPFFLSFFLPERKRRRKKESKKEKEKTWKESGERRTKKGKFWSLTMRGGDHEQVVFLLHSLSLSLSALHSFSFREKFLLLFLLHFLVFFFLFLSFLSWYTEPSLRQVSHWLSIKKQSICLSFSLYPLFFLLLFFAFFFLFAPLRLLFVYLWKRKKKKKDKTERRALVLLFLFFLLQKQKIPRDTKWWLLPLKFLFLRSFSSLSSALSIFSLSISSLSLISLSVVSEGRICLLSSISLSILKRSLIYLSSNYLSWIYLSV